MRLKKAGQLKGSIYNIYALLCIIEENLKPEIGIYHIVKWLFPA